jgi:hypothetical protein
MKINLRAPWFWTAILVVLWFAALWISNRYEPGLWLDWTVRLGTSSAVVQLAFVLFDKLPDTSKKTKAKGAWTVILFSVLAGVIAFGAAVKSGIDNIGTTRESNDRQSKLDKFFEASSHPPEVRSNYSAIVRQSVVLNPSKFEPEKIIQSEENRIRDIKLAEEISARERSKIKRSKGVPDSIVQNFNTFLVQFGGPTSVNTFAPFDPADPKGEAKWEGQNWRFHAVYDNRSLRIVGHPLIDGSVVNRKEATLDRNEATLVYQFGLDGQNANVSVTTPPWVNLTTTNRTEAHWYDPIRSPRPADDPYQLSQGFQEELDYAFKRMLTWVQREAELFKTNSLTPPR